MDNEQVPTVDDRTNRPVGRRAALKPAIAVLAGLLFFSFVSPTAVPLVMLVVGFIMLGVLLYGSLKILLLITGLNERLRVSRRRAIVLLGVCLPLLLIMLQSIGQLTIRDIVTLGGLFVVGVFYILRFERRVN